MVAATTASDTRRAVSTTDDDDYFSSSSMPLYDWSPTLTADNTMQVEATPPGSQFNLVPSCYTLLISCVYHTYFSLSTILSTPCTVFCC